MRLLSNLHVKGKPAVLLDRAIRRQSHYFIYRPRKNMTVNSFLHFNTLCCENELAIHVCTFQISYSFRMLVHFMLDVTVLHGVTQIYLISFDASEVLVKLNALSL